MINMRRTALLAATLGSLTLAAPLAAQDVKNAVKARQGSMQVLALNLGILGGMAKGAIPYDADAASSAAADLAAIGSLNPATYWVEGSDTESFDGSRANASAWADGSDFLATMDQLGTATAALADAAGNGEDALKAAFGPVGQACGTCHKAHRAKAN